MNVLALKACIHCNDFEKGKQIHLNIAHSLALTRTVICHTSLIGFYGHFGDIQTAVKLFKSILTDYDIVCINSMMTVYYNNDHYKECLLLYHDCTRHVKKNVVTFIMSIKACIAMQMFEEGKAIHNEMDHMSNAHIRTHVNYPHLLNILMEFYGTFGDIGNVMTIYNQMKKDKLNDIFSILSVMKALINNGFTEDALTFYDTQCEQMTFTNSIANPFVLKTLFRGFLDTGQPLRCRYLIGCRYLPKKKNIKTFQDVVHEYGAHD
eukprot:239391_1